MKTGSFRSLPLAGTVLCKQVFNRVDDVRIGATAADVAAHVLADFLAGASPSLLDQCGRGHDLPRRAVAALEGIVFDESRLNGTEPAILGQAFDCGDRAAVLHDSQQKTGVHPPPVDQHRAGPTLAMVTAFFRSGQTEIETQKIEQARPGSDVELPI